MLMCPDTFYEMRLKGKTPEQIMTVIRGLKQEIGRLKNILEHPNYECTMHPSEQVQISCSRDFLELAKHALKEAGGEYIPSLSEQKAIDFNNNIPYINKIEFCIGGYHCGYTTKTITFAGSKIIMFLEHSLDNEPTNDFIELESIEREEFLEQLSLRIGEWRRSYNTRRFGYTVCDGTQWGLEIYFSNGHKPTIITGDNAYPYNFDKILELFQSSQY